MLTGDQVRTALVRVPRDVRDYVNACLDVSPVRVFEATRVLAEHVGPAKAQEIVASMIREGQ